MGTVLSDGGLIDKTKEAIGEHEKAQEKEQEELGEAAGMMKNLIDGLGSTGGQGGGSSSVVEGKTGPTGKPLPEAVVGTEHETVQGEDSLGNPVVIQGGFKFVGQPTDTVEDGIIIEDDEGNQFVWIPVSNIDKSGKGLITKKDGTKVEITLGRYKFAGDSEKGKETLVQKGSESTSSDSKYVISGYFKGESITQFRTSVLNKYGYYIARYEAGKGENDKSVSKPGTVWNKLSKTSAKSAAWGMYSTGDYEANYVQSDLVNSYAWDTAIVYIQAMGNENYANANRDTTGNTSLMNAGETGDVKCNIFDMAANIQEWSTEISTSENIYAKYPNVCRGGIFNDAWDRAGSRSEHTTGMYDYSGIRVILYLK